MDKLVVTIGGLSVLSFIYWFFFGKSKDEIVEVKDNIDVIVDGGYKPAAIKIKKGKTATLRIKRLDTNSCLEEIIIPDFKVKEYLPLNKEVEIKISPNKNGEFNFHCGMNMYHGKIIVE